MPELLRRRRAGWAAYGTIKTVIGATQDQKLKAMLFDSTVLPALTYASETWALTKVHENNINTIQAALERRLVGITLRDQRQRGLHNSDIRKRSGVKDILVHINRAKHDWAGHLLRRNDSNGVRLCNCGYQEILQDL